MVKISVLRAVVNSERAVIESVVNSEDPQFISLSFRSFGASDCYQDCLGHYNGILSGIRLHN